MSGISVISTKQKIIVDPASYSVNVIKQNNLKAVESSPFEDVPWINVSFENLWVNLGAGNQPCQYRKVPGEVQFRGAARSGTIGQSIFALPTADYFPSFIQEFPTISNGAFGRIRVDFGGIVTALSGNNTSFWITCKFPVP